MGLCFESSFLLSSFSTSFPIDFELLIISVVSSFLLSIFSASFSIDFELLITSAVAELELEVVVVVTVVVVVSVCRLESLKKPGVCARLCNLS